MVNIHFEPITSHNRAAALALKISSSQKGFIETVAQCLEEAAHSSRWHPLAIYDGDTMVGFAMYGFFLWQYLPFGKLWLDRLMIDEKFQGKGYGHAAFEALVKRLIREFPNKNIYLSVIKENTAAIRLYEKFGFCFNGKRDTKGEYIMEYRIKDF